MIINQRNLNDAIGIIIKNDNVFERLKTDFPDILADLTTFKNNPNCTCRGKVVKYFSDRLNNEPDLLDQYVPNVQQLNDELAVLQAQRIQNNYSGKIFTIDNTEEAWLTFSQTLVGKIFRSFSVVNNGNTLTVYLL